MSEKVRFPIRVGRGRCRVTIYDPTAALPYYRICYRLGAIRHQRTCNSVSEAISHAESLSEKLRSKDASVTRISGNELAQFQVGRYYSNILPQTLLGSLYAFEMRYDIPVVWTADPDSAAKLIERWAKKLVTEITKVSFDVNCVKKSPSPNPVL